MTFSELQTAFFRRGFQRLNDAGAGLTEAKRWINQAYLELCDQQDWPFLEASISGAAPLTVSDLRTIESVTTTTSPVKLWPMPRHSIQTMVDPDLTTTGTPEFYYVTGGTVVNVYPANTGSITVKYWEVPAELSAAGDTPVVPARFHEAIVWLAARMAHSSRGNSAEAAGCNTEFEAILGRMVNVLLGQQHDSPDVQETPYGSLDD